jgi:P pilus assembly chaperone PapD
MNKSLMRAMMLWLTLLSVHATAGVVIGGTRFIYSEGVSSLSIPLRNTSASAWLISSHIQSASRWAGAENASSPASSWWVTPPLFTLAGGQENTLRIIHSGPPLPENRESLMTLSIAAIPSGKVSSNSVQMAYRSAMKLIYRPLGLTGDPQHAYQQLRWTLHATGLTVRNPTPYYVTLFMLRTNDAPVDSVGVVAPFSSRETRWCSQATACHLRWQSINDYGRVMPEEEINVVRRR